MLRYSSTFTGRDLNVELDDGISAPQDQTECRVLAPAGLEQKQGHAWAKKQANDVIRNRRRDIRIKHGFVCEIECKVPPFRSFMALDNLSASPGDQYKTNDTALNRLVLERDRQVARLDETAPKRFTCEPKKVLSLQKLRRQNSRKRKCDSRRRGPKHSQAFIQEMLETKFYVTGGKKGVKIEESKQVEDTAESPESNRFTGLFKPEAKTIEKEEANRKKSIRNWASQHSEFVRFAKQGDLESMKAIVRKNGGKYNVNAICNTGENALHGAADNAHVKIFIYLLGMGADPHIPSSKGKTANEILFTGKASVATHVNHSQLDFGRAVLDNTTIFTASQNGDISRVAWLLDSGIATVNDRNRYQMTPLHYAFMGQHTEIINQLLDRGASLDTKNQLGQAPSELATREFSEEIIASKLKSQLATLAAKKEQHDDFADLDP